jgi:hypothetical protein
MTTPLPPHDSGVPIPSPGDAPGVSADARWWSRPVPLWAVALIAFLGVGLGTVIGAADDDPVAAAGEPIATTDPGDEAAPSPSEDRTTTTRPPRTTTTRPATTTTTAPEGGTRENPFPVGTPLVTSDGVELVIAGVDLDAAAAIAAENMFNDEAPAGMRYVIVNIAVVNSSDEPIRPSWEIRVNAIGSQNRVHESCRAVLPNDLMNAPQLYPGGSASGNECVVVPQEEIDDGSLLLMVAPRFGDPVFVRP